MDSICHTWFSFCDNDRMLAWWKLWSFGSSGRRIIYHRVERRWSPSKNINDHLQCGDAGSMEHLCRVSESLVQDVIRKSYRSWDEVRTQAEIKTTQCASLPTILNKASIITPNIAPPIPKSRRIYRVTYRITSHTTMYAHTYLTYLSRKTREKSYERVG